MAFLSAGGQLMDRIAGNTDNLRNLPPPAWR
jgi:hypothetical protein